MSLASIVFYILAVISISMVGVLGLITTNYNLSLAETVFYVLATISLVGALGVVITRNVIYAAFLLLTSLMGVASIYLLLLAEFLALVQILIYGGAVIIVILFFIMLTRVHEVKSITDNSQKPFAVITSLLVFGLLLAGILNSNIEVGERSSVPFTELGNSLFTQWAVPFEVASLVLLIALIGAIVIARPKEDE